MSAQKNPAPVAIFIVLAALLGGCAAQVEMLVEPVDRLVPIISLKKDLVADMESIAVLPFTNSEKPARRFLPSPPFAEKTYIENYPVEQDGEYVAGIIAVRLKERSTIHVIGKAEIEELLAGKNVKITDIVDNQDALKIGRLLGVDGIVIGDVDLLRTEKKWKYEVPAYVHQDIAFFGAAFKLLSVKDERLAALVEHKLNSHNFISESVPVAASRGGSGSTKIVPLKTVIEAWLKEALGPIIEVKRRR